MTTLKECFFIHITRNQYLTSLQSQYHFYSCPEQFKKSRCQSVGWSVGQSVWWYRLKNKKVPTYLPTYIPTYSNEMSDSSDISNSSDSSDKKNFTGKITKNLNYKKKFTIN